MTVEIAGAFWVLPFAVLLLALSAVLVVVRLLRGPTGADRVVAIDALTLLGVAAVALIAMLSRQVVLLDVAVVLAFVSFLGTVAFTLLFRKPAEPHRNDEIRSVERRSGAPDSAGERPPREVV